jgi:hypothetical protein
MKSDVYKKASHWNYFKNCSIQSSIEWSIEWSIEKTQSVSIGYSFDI